MIRVAFNATSLLSPLTGIGQYSRQLALGLAYHEGIDADFFYGAAWSKKVRGAPLPGPAGLVPWLRSHVPYSYALRRLVQNNRFAQYASTRAFDLYHEPNILPLPFDGPTVITVHDLSWIRYPEAHPPERVRAMHKYFQPGLERASLVLTDSEFVKRELMDVFGVKPARICPVLLGVEAAFHPRSAGETQAVLDTHRLVHGQYLLAVGTLEPRKNLAVALQAFMQLPSPLRQRFPLVLVGMKGWHTSALEQQLVHLLAAGEVRQLGYLPRADLAAIIAGATTLIYPSVYEGFGLPPLEAMACGVPVITSNVSSIPEVVGDGGFMLAPQDVDGFATAMETLLSAPDVRDRMAHRALARSAHFTWDRCISQTVEAYYRVLSSSS
ncbi:MULTISPECIES: glycosyltransferase family 1 protein [Diaphorobacter]|uniref:Glycosyl transferase group 1 n=1 Tax=Acidovorax ebreus (strain TPSY) TaxID=535289 RepID=A0A9J9U9Z1_ACIET|nr:MULTISPECIES: glycosyltransferase family 1 protein [Diaphorobacter]ACM32038.1 glycosyl transferase group 1 [[Acidovorax] ebreus TPSY]